MQFAGTITVVLRDVLRHFGSLLIMMGIPIWRSVWVCRHCFGVSQVVANFEETDDDQAAELFIGCSKPYYLGNQSQMWAVFSSRTFRDCPCWRELPRIWSIEVFTL